MEEEKWPYDDASSDEEYSPSSDTDDSIVSSDSDDFDTDWVFGPPVPKRVNSSLDPVISNRVHWSQTLLAIFVVAVALWMLVPYHHPLRDVVVQRDLEALTQTLRDNGADPNACMYDVIPFPATYSALWLSLNHFNTTDTLLKYGANPNVPYKIAWGVLRLTCLTRALFAGDKRVVERLVKAGASSNDPASGFFGLLFKLQPLTLALSKSQPEVALRLLEEGASPTTCSTIGPWGWISFENSLTIAAASGDIDIVQRLLKAGANPSSYSGWGPWGLITSKSALYMAISTGNAKIVDELLRAGADPNFCRTYGGITFDCIGEARARNFGRIEELLKVHLSDGMCGQDV